MQKRSQLNAVLQAKCPRCREGDMFQYPVSNIARFDKMNKECPHCGLRFEIEPGFFFGAMYISYAISVAVLLTSAFILYYFFGDPDLWIYVITVPTVVVILLPFIFRFSRVLFLHVFGGISYNEKYQHQH
ncbi:MAG: DUF983 domain-containing protein [Candidatus Cyclobacteriaceae bacterium M3_2C_046]